MIPENLVHLMIFRGRGSGIGTHTLWHEEKLAHDLSVLSSGSKLSSSEKLVLSVSSISMLSETMEVSEASLEETSASLSTASSG